MEILEILYFDIEELKNLFFIKNQLDIKYENETRDCIKFCNIEWQ